MSAERATYLDSSAIVKLAVDEVESAALRSYLRRRRPLVSSSLARTEVGRAVVPLGEIAVLRGKAVLRPIELLKVSDHVLDLAATLLPLRLRSLDAIHLATAHQLGATLRLLVTYDERMAQGARALGWAVAAPS